MQTTVTDYPKNKVFLLIALARSLSCNNIIDFAFGFSHELVNPKLSSYNHLDPNCINS